MIKYEFMRAHGKGSEGSEKVGGVQNKKGGARKKGSAPHPLFWEKGGALTPGTPPVYATVYVNDMSLTGFKYIIMDSI